MNCRPYCSRLVQNVVSVCPINDMTSGVLFFIICCAERGKGVDPDTKVGGDGLLCKPNLFQLGVWRALSAPQRGPGQSPGGKRILAKIFCKLTRSLFGRRVHPYFRSDKRLSLVGTARDRQCCPWLCKTC